MQVHGRLAVPRLVESKICLRGDLVHVESACAAVRRHQGEHATSFSAFSDCSFPALLPLHDSDYRQATTGHQSPVAGIDTSHTCTPRDDCRAMPWMVVPRSEGRRTITVPGAGV